MKRILLALALAVVVSDPSYAGWGSGGCSSGRCSPSAEAPFTGWCEYGAQQVYYRGGVPVGSWHAATKEYRAFDAATGQWGAVQAPPWGEPCKCDKDCACGGKCPGGCKCDPFQQVVPRVENFGVDATKLHKDGQAHHWIDGKSATKQQVLDALTLTDDSNSPYVTFIGNNRDKSYQAFIATPDAAKCRVKSYAADAWEVSKVGFKTDGSPTIYVQKPTGEVVARFDSDPGSKLFDAIRKADPSYDPSKDPNGSVAPINLSAVPTQAWVLGGLGLLAFLLKRKAS